MTRNMAKILLVDDNALVLQSVKGLLTGNKNYSVVCAVNGEEAQKLLETEDFDLMITDIRMGPVDGMQLIVSTRASKPELPIVIASALTSDKVVEQAARLGVVGYIKKPFKMAEMIDVVERALEGGK